MNLLTRQYYKHCGHLGGTKIKIGFFWLRQEPLNLPFFAISSAGTKAKSAFPSRTALVQSLLSTHVRLAIIADLHFVSSLVQILTREKF